MFGPEIATVSYYQVDAATIRLTAAECAKSWGACSARRNLPTYRNLFESLHFSFGTLNAANHL